MKTMDLSLPPPTVEIDGSTSWVTTSLAPSQLVQSFRLSVMGVLPICDLIMASRVSSFGQFVGKLHHPLFNYPLICYKLTNLFHAIL